MQAVFETSYYALPASTKLLYSLFFTSTRFFNAFSFRSVCDNSDVELITAGDGISCSNSLIQTLFDSITSTVRRVKSKAVLNKLFFCRASAQTVIHVVANRSLILFISSNKFSSTLGASSVMTFFTLETLGSKIFTSSCSAYKTVQMFSHKSHL